METTPPTPAEAASPAHRLPVVGFDTGFFVRLLQADPRAVAAWGDVRARRSVGTASCVTLFELDRLGLKGHLEREPTEALVAALPTTCRVVWLDELEGADRLRRAVRLGHGNGLAMADSITLSSLLDVGARTVYTTDPDLDRYDGPVEVVRL
ncbi:type II toxin-antitoxin system VapC family toxin [Rubrivirga sp.]|uniref:type II toxin-antitoxin system VapC family toxin n=1 Tax=Rubrivirga sp. TaxID=1885344 RepID=UPI003C75471A